MARGIEGKGYHRFFFIDGNDVNQGWALWLRTVYHGVYDENGIKDIFIKQCRDLKEVMRVQDCILPGLT